jgi:hypothetical protein
MRRCTRQRCAGAPDHISRLIILRYGRRPVGSILPWPASARRSFLIAIFERDRSNKGIRAADLRQRGETVDKSGPDRKFRSWRESDHRRGCRWSTIRAQSVQPYSRRRPPQSRDTGRCFPIRYDRGEAGLHASFRSCDKSGQPSCGALSACRKMLTLSQCFNPAVHQPGILAD